MADNFISHISKYMRWETVFAIVPLCICGVGILLTIVTFAIFFKHRDTPLVRASGRELSYVILAGLLVCFLNTYILLAKPGTVVCLLQRSVEYLHSDRGARYALQTAPCLIMSYGGAFRRQSA